MIIRWTTPATEELVSAYEYIAAENPSAAREIMNYISETVDILARHPIAGRKAYPGKAGTGHSRDAVYRWLSDREKRGLDTCGDACGEKVAG